MRVNMIDQTEETIACKKGKRQGLMGKTMHAAMHRIDNSKLLEFEHSLRGASPQNASDPGKIYALTSYILFFFVFSIVGWIWEVMLHFVRYGILVNRGTLLGPWLPIYGTGGLLVLILLRKAFKNPVLTFVLATALTSFVEYCTGWFLEAIYDMKWWNYSGYFMNLHGRICLEASLIFGVGTCMIVYVGAPMLDRVFMKINLNRKRILCAALIVIFLVDFSYCSKNPNVGKGITSKKPSNTISLEVNIE